MYVTKGVEVIWFAAPTANNRTIDDQVSNFTKEEKGDKYVNAMLTIFPNIGIDKI